MKAIAFTVLTLYIMSFASLLAKREKISFIFFLCGTLINFVFLLVRSVCIRHFPATTFYDSLFFFSLSSAIFALYFSWRGAKKLTGIVGFIAFLLMLPTLFMDVPKPLIPPSLKSYWLPIHSGLSFLGYGALSVSFIVSILYLLKDWSIRKKKGFFAYFFPPIETLDRINYTSLMLGFLFLTLGIITGSLWAEKAWGSYWSWDPKETWSLISWLIYAACIHQRFAVGWRGRKGAYLSIVGFLTIIFSFFVVNLVIPGLHSYIG